MVRKGTLNKLIDEILHPKIVKAQTKAEADGLYLLDLLCHFAVEQNPPESILKAMKYGRPDKHKKRCRKAR